MAAISGTVICPDADAKIFVTASPEARARRRHLELDGNGETVSYESVLADIRRRDERDTGRTTAPLMPADDAAVLDTTDLDVEGAYAAALRIVKLRLAALHKDAG
jgi:cytidylate kinase (EC 2.7.4.14)